ncbi:MAG: transketolase, partial [Desulfovibrio sp.]
MPSRKVLADAVRCLSMDAVQKANSGHPGAPMGMADMAEVLWNDFMTHNPANPQWMYRDRFVLSNGHASMLIYSMLHLTGYDLTIDDIKNFRQLHSKTAGHPEYMECPGVETTTGPLGQGIANGVGMALAEKMLAEQFNRDEFKVIDHFTYVFLGDGCMMEGISHEACSYAGALELGKLIALYDDNGISIDGEVEGWFVDDTAKRFEAYNWHVIDNVDGHDPEAVKAAIEAARAETSKPSLICCKTHIAYGSPNKQDSSKSHGAPLGDEEIALVREKLGWEHPPFEIPTEVYEGFDARQKGSAAETAWNDMFTAYGAKYPELAADLTRRMNRDLPEDFEATCEALFADLNDKKQDLATRKANVAVLEGLASALPELLGGSADLTGSNGCWWSGSK